LAAERITRFPSTVAVPEYSTAALPLERSVKVHVPSSLIRRLSSAVYCDAPPPTSCADPYHVPLNGERPVIGVSVAIGGGIEAVASFAAGLLAQPANSAVIRAMLNRAIDRFVISLPPAKGIAVKGTPPGNDLTAHGLGRWPDPDRTVRSRRRGRH
jgi:hypothetical protein